jgi:O-antigen/teichoic acid export membrane protein
MLGTLAKYGGGMFLINVGEIVRFQLGPAVIAYFLAPELIAVYSIGGRLVHMAYQALGVIGAVFVPRFSGMHEQGDQQGYERLLRRANRVTDLAAAYILVNIGYLGLPFLAMWIRKPWVGDAFTVSLIVLPGYFVALMAGPGLSLLIGAGRLRGLTALTLIEAAFNFVLSLALVRWLGIYGVCLGAIIPMIVSRGFVFPFVLRSQVGIPVRVFYRSHLPGVALAVVYAVLLLPVLRFQIVGPVAFIAAGACTTAVFAALLLVAVPEVRERVLGRLVRRGR